MYRRLKSVSALSLVCLSFISPFLTSGTSHEYSGEPCSPSLVLYQPPATRMVRSPSTLVMVKAQSLYDSMDLRKFGLSRKAFEYAWKGYEYMLHHGWLRNKEVLSICDFSQSSRRKRLYVIDVNAMRLVVNTYVAHGRNSGGLYASSFSNSPESHKSSLGFYITRNTYYGDHGLALKIDGRERGINDNAEERNIVVHGSEYVGANYLRYNRMSGRSYGCPAIPEKYTNKVIETIKNGSCLFIYHPSKYYLLKSRILNG